VTERTPLVYAPGFQQEYYIDNRNHTGSHNRLMYVFGRAGFEPHFYQPNWRVPDPLAWASGMAEYATSIAKGRSVTLAGFSLGSVAAALATAKLEQSTDIEVGGLVACSLSPTLGARQVQAVHLSPSVDVSKMSELLKDTCCAL
jgi:pimeloyl-ACP methyl ester carboxylesterase